MTKSETLRRFERALRKALNTPPEAPRKRAQPKRKRKRVQ
jgi:hypothetical protein